MDDLPRPAPASNIPEYSVSEISGAVKRTLEGAFGRVRVRGEITELKRYNSGHIYFCLKDEGGKMRGIAWRSVANRLGLVPENGLEVIATGRVSAYGDRSEYQLLVDRMEYAGVGALLKRIEMLRQRLAGEGLFDEARKRPIPLLPDCVGVVTSAQGAVIHDIRTTVARRFPRHILLWPVPVQGEGAAERIAAAIAGFDAIAAGGAIPRPDVLIVARGGGSVEDLMAFNEEIVLRAASACRIPLISAVGHETDTTLIDFVSDRRAPTPTAAAEMAVPSRIELAAGVQHKAARMASGLHRLTQERRLRLDRLARGLPDLPSLAGAARQRLDDRAARLDMALPNLLAARRSALVRAERGLADPRAVVRAARQLLSHDAERLRLALPNLLAGRRAALVRAERGLADPTHLVRAARQRLLHGGERLELVRSHPLAARRAALAQIAGRLPDPDAAIAAGRAALSLAARDLRAALRLLAQGRRGEAARIGGRLSPAPLQARLRESRARLDGLSGRLDSVSPEAVLARGYALVFDASGHPVTEAASVRPGTGLRLRFADGEAQVTADGRRRADGQGKLAI